MARQKKGDHWMSVCIVVCICGSDSLCHFKPISSVLHNFSLQGEKDVGLFDMWLLTTYVSTAATEEMVRLYQIRSSAEASGAVSHGRRQPNFSSRFGLALMI